MNDQLGLYNGPVTHLVWQDSYVLQRRGQVTSAGGRIRRSWMKTAVPDGKWTARTSCIFADSYVPRRSPTFPQSRKEIGRRIAKHYLRRSSNLYLFTEARDPGLARGTHHRESSEGDMRLLILLPSQLDFLALQIGDDYYRQKVGIPQGSVLSTLLCSFFYGDLEKAQLKFTEDSQSVSWDVTHILHRTSLNRWFRCYFASLMIIFLSLRVPEGHVSSCEWCKMVRDT